MFRRIVRSHSLSCIPRVLLNNGNVISINCKEIPPRLCWLPIVIFCPCKKPFSTTSRSKVPVKSQLPFPFSISVKFLLEFYSPKDVWLQSVRMDRTTWRGVYPSIWLPLTRWLFQDTPGSSSDPDVSGWSSIWSPTGCHFGLRASPSICEVHEAQP